MSLSAQLTERREYSRQNLAKDVHVKMMDATRALIESGIADSAPKVGQRLTAFQLPNQLGETRNLDKLLEKGPVVITFYRGGWCPYCSMELRAYQKVLHDISALGATLVAITPELPDASLSTIEKNELAFEVLSDTNSDYARKLGLVFSLPETLRAIYENFGVEVEKHNGEGQFDLPLPATFIVGNDGIIVSAFVHADYTLRKEPDEVVAELRASLNR